MKKAVAGKPFVQHVDFIVNGEFVVPQSASYTIRNNAQEVVDALENEPINGTGSPVTLPTSIDIYIPSTVQTVDSPMTLRYVDVEFLYNGIIYQLGDLYQVLDSSFVIPVRPDDVRGVLGLSSADLPDSSIDIYNAYLLVQGDAGAELEAIITSGSEQLPYLIEAVSVRAAMVHLGSLQLGLMQSEQADNTKYTRFSKMDPQAIWGALRDRYTVALQQLTPGGIATTPLLATTAVGTDPVTGV